MALLKMTAVVLVGGRSRRMGGPKALLRLAGNGPTMIERVVAAVSEIAEEVILVGGATWSIPESLVYLPRVPDAGNGAADGVVAALQASSHPLCIVVACDMPFLDPELLRRMAEAACDQVCGVMLADECGLHPLHAVYRTKDLGRIEEIIASGERTLSTIAENLGMVRFVPDGDDGAVRGAWSAFNVNTPEDLEVARRHMEEVRDKS